jgi:hypothetical protein
MKAALLESKKGEGAALNTEALCYIQEDHGFDSDDFIILFQLNRSFYPHCAMSFAQPLTEMSTENLSGFKAL